MGSMVSIRQFRPEDAPEVIRLFTEGQRQFSAGFEMEIEAYIEESLRGDLQNIPLHYLSEPGGNFWVAEVSGQVVGCAGVQRQSAEVAELRRMSVDIRWRRQGIARRLLEEVEGFALRYGYQRLCLSTITPLKPAISMYERAGYELTGKSQYGAITVLHYVKQLVSPPGGQADGRN